jgi:hypothetical protein
MLLSDRFVRFAAECEVMAQRCPDPENRVVWRKLAARWIRCAQLTDQESQRNNGAYDLLPEQNLAYQH